MTQERLVIIDYGSGNLRSAQKAFEHVIAAEGLNHTVTVSPHAEDIAKAGRIILPGQGAFGDCISHLRALPGMIEALEERVLRGGVPFLGVCVGMQLLASKGLEHGTHEGLGWIDGQVTAMADKITDKTLKIPHMGWNTVTHKDNHPVLCSIETSPKTPEHYYFVHSFMFECKERAHILAETDYGVTFPAAVGRDNILGVQFHPEKSQHAGLTLLRNFVHWRP